MNNNNNNNNPNVLVTQENIENQTLFDRHNNNYVHVRPMAEDGKIIMAADGLPDDPKGLTSIKFSLAGLDYCLNFDTAKHKTDKAYRIIAEFEYAFAFVLNSKFYIYDSFNEMLDEKTKIAFKKAVANLLVLINLYFARTEAVWKQYTYDEIYKGAEDVRTARYARDEPGPNGEVVYDEPVEVRRWIKIPLNQYQPTAETTRDAQEQWINDRLASNEGLPHEDVSAQTYTNMFVRFTHLIRIMMALHTMIKSYGGTDVVKHLTGESFHNLLVFFKTYFTGGETSSTSLLRAEFAALVRAGYDRARTEPERNKYITKKNGVEECSYKFFKDLYPTSGNVASSFKNAGVQRGRSDSPTIPSTVSGANNNNTNNRNRNNNNNLQQQRVSPNTAQFVFGNPSSINNALPPLSPGSTPAGNTAPGMFVFAPVGPAKKKCPICFSYKNGGRCSAQDRDQLFSETGICHVGFHPDTKKIYCARFYRDASGNMVGPLRGPAYQTRKLAMKQELKEDKENGVFTEEHYAKLPDL